jgi:putative nucleotidyltransferase with HDIG domain
VSRATSPEVQELIDGATVVSLPAVYRRITEVIDHPHSSAADIAKVVSDDPSLTVRLLALVNSAFMGFPNKIETVSQAINLVGTEQLADLALATSVMQMFGNVPPKAVDMKSYWRHSLATATYARAIATLRHEGNVERFFVAGLLHDIGSLVIYTRKRDALQRCLRQCERSRCLLHTAERKLLRFDHAEVGRALLKAWNLPLSHQDAVGSHHDPSSATCFPTEAAVVHVADVIANALSLGNSGERLVPELDPQAWDRLGLADEAIPGLIAEGEQQFEEVQRTMLWNDTE